GGVAALGRPAAEEEPEAQDFWAALRRVSAPPLSLDGGQAAIGAAAQDGSGSSGAGQGRPGGRRHRHDAADGMAVYTATGHLPGAAGDALPGGAVGQGALARGGSEVVQRGGGGAPTSIATRKATAFSRPGRGGDWSDGEDQEESFIRVNVASIEPGHSLWHFTGEEQQELARMVREHEESDNNADIVDLLLIMLRLEDEPQILVAILAFLKEEFRITLSNRRFAIGHGLLVKVNDLSRELPPDKAWVQPFLGRFFEDIVEPEILDSLTSLWPELPKQPPEALQNFSAILRLLPPSAGVALVPLLSRVEAGVGRRILLDMIGVFAARDLTVIDTILDRPEEDLLLKLVQVLHQSPSHPLSDEFLFRTLRHPKETVRAEALAVLLERESERYDRLFPLIHDPSPTIRKSVFLYLGRERNPEVERLLLAHLASERFLFEDHVHVASCYLALGLCGSDHCLPYLRQVLFGQPWNFLVGIGAAQHRQGAALALSKLHTRASRQLLEEAEDSAVPHIRKAWAKATGN
ncbi:MAG: hypothetical protein HGA96_14995, partial [Desulfobulbaceae bacterium]|nr:hypothetical protein [Desulfobulbaceae bacterium]